MAKSRNKHQHRNFSKRDQARAIAKQFEAKHLSISQKLGLIREKKKKPTEWSKKRMKVLCKFGISFTIPDRMATEINDRKMIKGLHPLRIKRIPSGGPMEFHEIAKEAEKVSSPLKKKQQPTSPPNPKAEYHRCHFNHWHPQLFHFISGSYIIPQ